MSLYDEGHTIAGWTGVGIATLGSAVAGWGVCAASVPLIGAGLAVVAVSALVTWFLHLTGWGKLNIAAAVRALRAGQAPTPDRFEPNDDIDMGHAIRGRRAHFRATVDFWDDATDIYRIKLKRGQRVVIAARPSSSLALTVSLWRPALGSLSAARAKFRLRHEANGAGVIDRVKYRARKTGWYSLQVSAARPGFGSYSLRVKRR